MKLKSFFVIPFALLLTFSFVFSTEKEFTRGFQFVSPLIGLNNYALPVGANFEFGLTKNIGIGGTATLWSWGEDYWSNTLINLSVDAAYHFTDLKVKKLDLFAGGGLGISIYSWKWKSEYENIYEGATASSGIYIQPYVGARYFFSQKLLDM